MDSPHVRAPALTWTELGEEHLTALAELATACLAADGGLPLFARPPLLRARLLRDRTLGAWCEGCLVAAIGLSTGRIPTSGTGLVHPDWRGQGLGSRLLNWADEQTEDVGLVMITESWSPGEDNLFTMRGFARTFMEWVLRHDLGALPDVAPPEGIHTEPVTTAAGPELFATYREAFADRPGFVAPAAEEWLAELWDDDRYRPELSLLARTTDGAPVAFLTVIDNWVDQVGVVPAWRGRRIGAHLVATALRSLTANGAPEAWLNVNDNNPAIALYRRLGFCDAGRRAHYTLRPSPLPAADPRTGPAAR